MSYKDTLNLPKTDFSMKANLPQNEPKFLKLWQDKNLYGLIRKNRAGKTKYVLHDGPPYANGDIHIGHVLNKTLKDFVVKYQTMKGYDSPYVPGWDCHGLPVEHQLFKELGISKYDIDQVKFREKAHNYALKYVDIQKEQFKRLGVLGDWENPYLTLTPDYEEAIVSSFSELVKKGYIYRKRKPVNWCYRCETALAEAEVEYENHSSPSIYVKFKINDNKFKDDKHFLIIWTTTPWTLVGNVAVAVHPDRNYVSLRVGDETFFVLKDLVEVVREKLDFKDYKITSTLKGKDLEGLIYSHPFIKREGRVVLANYVSTEDGTGLVHTAPGHGQEDYLTGLKYNLEVIMLVDEKGNFDESAGEFKGLNVNKANKLIVKGLSESGALLNKPGESISHSYPHCWRCKNPIIFRATAQWFMSIDHKDLRKSLLKQIDKIKWIPAIGQDRISAMVSLRPDWCLSRQRYWGVPIPAVRCLKCEEEILDPKIIDNFAKIVSKEGTDSWFIKDIKEFICKGFKCPNCSGQEFEKSNDILDVWFDSGVSCMAVLKKRKNLDYPCELYLEGSDQHRGWFQSSLIPAMAIDNKSPFKNVLTHGFVVDGAGRKMSKSLGNVVSPQEVMKDYGADILRLWTSSCDYSDDVRISPEILKRLAEAYRKIRNTARYLLGNLYDFKKSDSIKYNSLLEIDRWALSKLHSMIKAVEKAYDEFAFYKVYQIAYKFCIVDMSSFYLDILKDRLYTYSANSTERRSAQTVLYQILNSLTKIIAPILSFTAEEIWLLKFADEAESVHLSQWPILEKKFIDTALEGRWQKIFTVRDKVLKAIEEKRITGEIRSSLESKVKIATTNKGEFSLLKNYSDQLPFIFIVSQIDLSSSEDKIAVSKAEGQKCPRCWNYFASKDKEDICPRCKRALSEGGK